MLPVQVDAWYRTGASAIAISVVSMAVAAWALASLIIRHTGSIAGGSAGAALLLANPNILYLQSTPMTEPLLFGTTMLAVTLTAEWVDRGGAERPRQQASRSSRCATRMKNLPAVHRSRPGVRCAGARRSLAVSSVARFALIQPSPSCCSCSADGRSRGSSAAGSSSLRTRRWGGRSSPGIMRGALSASPKVWPAHAAASSGLTS
jgi:hypothetical protein